MKRIFFILCMTLSVVSVVAQPAKRRVEQQKQQTQTGANALTTRALISFPTVQEMPEDVVWRRDLYREVKLTDDANAGLYYPTEPIGSQMNLFTYIFKLMLHRDIYCYEYRLDGNELFTDSARIKPIQFLDNYKIYYERRGKGIYLDNSDIPSGEVKRLLPQGERLLRPRHVHVPSQGHRPLSDTLSRGRFRRRRDEVSFVLGEVRRPGSLSLEADDDDLQSQQCGGHEC